MERRLFLSLALACCIPGQAFAINNGSDDVDTPVANATVWIGGCTGALITQDIVVSAGHCFTRPSYAPAPEYPDGCTDTEVSGRWYPLPSRPAVRVGADLSDLTSPSVFQTRAVEYTMPGCADIFVVRLDSPVPAEFATPVKVLTEIGEGVGATVADTLFDGATFTAAGWGRAAGMPVTVRQTATMTYAGSNASFVLTRGPNGTLTTDSGDSGGPLYWDAPSGRRFLVGVLQGFRPDRYTPTFRNSHSGFPDVGAFFERVAPDAVSCDQFADRPDGTVPLVRYWDPDRQDNFTTADGEWIGCSETRRSPNYKMSRLEGYIFDPGAPQPRGTVRLYSWWSGERQDNVITSYPTWIHWEGGPQTRASDYQLVEFEGYAFDPAREQPEGTIPLYAWVSFGRGDYWTTTQHAENAAAGEGLSPDYGRPTLMGYVFPAAAR